MAFNVKKCKIMHFGSRNPNTRYSMAGQDLETTNEERDMGVTISSSLKPSAQCTKAARTATVVLGQIARAFQYRDRHIFVRLYIQYVRPHLEFASQAWSPWLLKDIETLEKVQRRAIGMVSGLRGQTYEEKLQELGLQSLEERRLDADLILVYKSLTGLCNVDSTKWFEKSEAGNQRTRAASDDLHLRQPFARLDAQRYFFTVRVIESWNRLPYRLRSATSLTAFKNGLKKHRATPSEALATRN